jgi:glycosyltransferase involved in cell wall biosynthesis
MKKLYIVSLKTFFYKDGKVSTYGGFGEYVKMFLDDFDEVHLCVPLADYEIDGGYPLEDPKIKYHFLPYYHNELWLLIKSPLIFLYLLFYLPKADVINPRIPDMTGVYGWMIGKLFRKPMFISVQSDITLLLESAEGTRLKGFMKKGLFAWFRFYLIFEKMIIKDSLSFPQGYRLINKYCKDNPKAIPWISTAIKENDIELRYRDKAIKENDIINLLIVARICVQKSHKDLVSAVKILVDNGYKNIRLNIVGKKDERVYGNLIEQIDKLGLKDYINIYPPINHGDELWKMFDSADIFVLSSLWEGTPKVLLEAMARSLPVVSTNVGGVPSVIKNGVNGFMCEPNNPEDLAKKIEKMINLDLDELNNFIRRSNNMAKKNTLKFQKQVIIDNLYKFGILKK